MISAAHSPGTSALIVLALAVLPGPGSGTAAAQSGLDAVVCVGGTLETVPGTDPARQVFRTDQEIAYITDVDPAYRDEAEQAAREHLAHYSEIWCAWSEPGDAYLSVVTYTAVARLDGALDPDDPRFPNFSIGYGTNWADAEANATQRNDRFSAYNDGSGYSFMLRMTWGIVEDEPNLPTAWPDPPGSFRDCDTCPAMVFVPAGIFMMGSPVAERGRRANEQPRHFVTIEAPFAVGVYEVTAGEWGACVLHGPCATLEVEDEGRNGERLPVSVTWDEAQAYVAWLSEETGRPYRLPSEAEWEYVARAGTEGARYWEGGGWQQCDYANGADAAALRQRWLASTVPCSDGFAGFAPVGMFSPNRFGLRDVLGNASEWTQDCWNPLYTDAPRDGSAWEQGDCGVRVVRGGGMGSGPYNLRSAARVAVPTDFTFGFRVVRDSN